LVAMSRAVTVMSREGIFSPLCFRRGEDIEGYIGGDIGKPRVTA
jgi:hypothetical protein